MRDVGVQLGAAVGVANRAVLVEPAAAMVAEAAAQVVFRAAVVTAVGQFSVGRNAQVEGNMAVTLQTSVSSQTAPVHIFGVLPNLSATTRK